MLLSLLLMLMDHRFHQTESLRSSLAVVVQPLNILADLPAQSSHWLRKIFTNKQQLQLENNQLSQSNIKLKAELQQFHALLAENERLRDLLGSAYKVSNRVLIAELSSVNLNPHRQQIMLKKGSTSGVFEGQAVLDAQAVMGQVTHVTPFTATVLLITDIKHALPVQVLRNGLRTIAVGTGQTNRLELPYLPNNADIEAGDLLVTSGFGHKFPAGYPVAKIKEISIKPGKSFAQVIAEPMAKLDSSNEVLLVWELELPKMPTLPKEHTVDAADTADTVPIIQDTPQP